MREVSTWRRFAEFWTAGMVGFCICALLTDDNPVFFGTMLAINALAAWVVWND